jgi:hypothetical protein
VRRPGDSAATIASGGGWLGFRGRLAVVVIVAIVLAVGALALIARTRIRASAEAAGDRHARMAAMGIARLVAEPASRGDLAEARARLQALSSPTSVLYSRVELESGSPLIALAATDVEPPGDLVASDDGALARGELVAHVAVRLAPLGARGLELRVGFSLHETLRAQREASRSIGLLTLALMAVGIALAWSVGGWLGRPLRATASTVASAADRLVAIVRRLESKATEEGVEISATIETMELMLDTARRIAHGASEVLGDAERTLQASRDIEARIGELTGHADVVGELLATIRRLADRTDLLALNAALEGTRAGEAGQGFTRVAAELRRLAEHVASSAEQIAELMRSIRTSSALAVHASAQGADLSDRTTRSVRDIAQVTDEQRGATQQVSESMRAVSEALRTRGAAIGELAELAEQLRQVARRLRDDLAAGDPGDGASRRG